MSVLFDNVKVGDTVHYSTPQGQTGKGKVVIHKGTHLVLNAGGRHGRPQVVTDKNYIKHSREGKVVGALLSRVHHVKEDSKLFGVVPFKKGDKSVADKVDHAYRKTFHKKRALDAIYRKLDRASARTAANKSPVEESVVGKVSKLKTEATWQGAEDPYNWDPVMRQQIFAAAAKKERAKQKQKGQPVPHELDTGRTLKSAPAPFRRGVKEDSHDAEGAAERVAKTKKHKKKLHEVSTGTLASYVSKAIADRKKAEGGADMARRIHTPDRAAYFVDKMAKRAAKRSKGIKTAVGKIAKAYEETEVTEAKAPYGRKAKPMKPVNWEKTETLNYSVPKFSEGGVPLKVHMLNLAAAGVPSRKWHSPYVGHTALQVPKKHARKASKILYGYAMSEEAVNEAQKIDRYTTHHDDYMVTSTTGPAGHTISVRQGGTLIAQRLGGKLITNSKSGKKDTKLQDVIKAHTDHPEVQKFLKTNEARENEWTANQQLAGTAAKKAKGHYLVRNGRTLSGPHKPDEAVRAYKDMGDNTGVKIVHVKEEDDKYKKAVMKAVSLRKKAKGNKHVDTEPSLKMPDKGTNAPLEGTHADNGADDAKI